ncbi:riboflavin biosynthesis protein RibD domain-containing protein, variant [Saprolegnia diclina VS20]|uniref:Riboflavin biosynthesis protein RibD domain-containing protein n=1 Tax=Saprolegnia diclina (strain VS20) TaxID=1156394 RepID=T0RID1_SAPDV|nr:riboflavin biosynthesis protein RibD domain-containing protein [Saprolegnia diclina VS20]XP_008616896.1 riboflavin biosynthesis protein RibD domain-containing protein, variant [Saprolegnia diclina VS20]EQC29591.1 riboflavin biosynthesis protein RibD domain-containing protein [Saprolegnia diclina VS20]EQC29592.1 riboflavin biosynthesis protein RibD domain-containing protein, variant [Saprolegnia diclina VS20]|eukprot:XP_008616895.1 riboflavin biosynthesis protein RibD domain-containing protein [Saprolegnia diclina VS20]
MDAVVDFHTRGVIDAQSTGRLHVTMTYAQSLDGSIAAIRGQPTLLSGPESMAMTHQLRTLHDGILVGVGTIQADNPSLTVRLVPPPFENPQPIIVDTRLELPLDCKLLTSPLCKRPWVLTTDGHWDQGKLARKSTLEAHGARIIPCKCAGTTHIDWSDAFDKLRALGLLSVMIEGGASILTSVLRDHAHTPSGILHHAIITVAPTFIGGLHALTERLPADAYPTLSNTQAIPLGKDIVLVGKFA